MKILRLKIGVALQHSPIFVTSHQSYLLDGKSRLKQPAGAFVAKVMEMQVIDL